VNITQDEIGEALGLHTDDVQFRELGLLYTRQPDSLSFIEKVRYVEQLKANKNITGVFATEGVAKLLAGSAITTIVCDDPRYYFYTLYNYCARTFYVKTPTEIHPSALVHPRAYVAEHNVVIGAQTVVEPNATILPDVKLGVACFVGANTVLGCDDAEIKRTSKAIFKVVHDGRLIIGDRVEIGVNCTVDKGFSFQNTIIGDDTKLANATFVGHSVVVGKRCLLLACTVLGSAHVDDDVRINPGAVVSNKVKVGSKANITLGAIVVQDVPEGGHVTGNFGIDHARFMYKFAKTFGPF